MTDQIEDRTDRFIETFSMAAQVVNCIEILQGARRELAQGNKSIIETLLGNHYGVMLNREVGSRNSLWFSTSVGLLMFKALALELMLKALCYADDIEPPTRGRQGHDLAAIFDHLHLRTQNRIDAKLPSAFPRAGQACDREGAELEVVHRPNVRAILVEHRDDFVEKRYSGANVENWLESERDHQINITAAMYATWQICISTQNEKLPGGIGIGEL